jgi:purine-binding chemotaxis protein CheW
MSIATSIRPRLFAPLAFINTLVTSPARYKRLVRARVVRPEYLCFTLDKKEYALDILHVRRILAHERLIPIANGPRFVKGLINVRRSMIPVVDLRGDCGPGGHHGFAAIVTLEVAERRIGILIDAVSDVLPIAADQIRAVAAPDGACDPGFIRGLASIGGRILNIVDIARLMESSVP